MKLTQVLWKQHLGRMTKRHWFIHGQQVLGDTLTESVLVKKGIKINDAMDFLEKPKLFPPQNTGELYSGVLLRRPQHKNERRCLQHNTDDVLIQGIDQAQILTKTLIVSDTLPDKIENLLEDTTNELDNILTGIIYTSNIFDAHQQKLPKKKDPLRPAWVFPREYGIDDVRKSRNLSQKMLQLCELISGSEITQQRQFINNGLIQVTLEKEGDLLMFNSTIDMMLMSVNGIKPMGSAIDTSQLAFPNIHPLTSTVNLHGGDFCKAKELYPVSNKSRWMNVHTIFIYHNSEKVKNVTELPVTEDQLLARSMIKSFVSAVGYAKQKFGNNVADLPEPITIQCIQTNSQTFHFSVFQLNTLNIDGDDGKCNLWWSMPQIKLFETASYNTGIPTLTEYNPEVFKRILAFYRNI